MLPKSHLGVEDVAVSENQKCPRCGFMTADVFNCPMCKTKKEPSVFLHFNNPKLDESPREVLACGNCQNKTYLLTYPNGQDNQFAMVQCCACGVPIGRMGWVHE